MDAITWADLQSIDMELPQAQICKKNYRDYAVEVAEFLAYGALMVATIGVFLGVMAFIALWGGLALLEIMVINFPR